jgi:hypothetical protein
MTNHLCFDRGFAWRDVDVGDLSSGPAVIEGRTADRATRGLNFLSAETSLGAPASRKSSIFLGRKVGATFMRVNSTCAHHSRLMSYPEPASSFDRLMEHVIHRWRGH